MGLVAGITIGDYVIDNDRFKIGRVQGFCKCEMCKERGFYEPNITNGIFITNFDKNNDFCNYKFSKDIADLLEDEDVVVIEYYIARYKERISRKFIVDKSIDNFITFENAHCTWYMSFKDNKWNWVKAKGFNPKIVSVLTNTQFRDASCDFR